MFFSLLENEVKYDRNNNEEDEGEQFDFDSGDEIPEADRPAAGTPAGGGGADAASGSGESPGRPQSPWPSSQLVPTAGE